MRYPMTRTATELSTLRAAERRTELSGTGTARQHSAGLDRVLQLGCVVIAGTLLLSAGIRPSQAGQELTAVEAQATGVPAQASPVLKEVEHLLDLNLLPKTRSSLEQSLCSPQRRVPASALAQLLGAAAPQLAQISGARIARCRADPELAPLMFQAFLSAKFGYLPNDPDIFERLLRGLQELPIEQVSQALLGAVHDPLLDAAWNHLLDTRLEALSSDISRTRPMLNTAQRQATRDFLSKWLRELLEGPGLVALQADSGDLALQLLERLQAVLVAQLIESGDTRQIRAAVEVARLFQRPHPEPHRALAERARLQPQEQLVALLELLPEPGPSQAPASARRYPIADIQLSSSRRNWELNELTRTDPTHEQRIALLLCALLAGAWLLAVAGWPHWRRALLRIGALSIAPCLLIGAELSLGLLGVAPLMDLRPSFNPNQSPSSLFSGRTLEGLDYIVTADGRARQLAFPVEKSAEGWRVFVLGESSAHASYYPIEDGFAAHLENGLRARHPNQDLEVINAGVGAALSDEIAHYSFEALRYGADLLVLYLGNNDMSHFVAMAGFRGYSPRRIALRYALDRSRLIRVISDLLPQQVRRIGARSDTQDAFLDTEAMTDQQRSFLLRLAERNARQNIERIVLRARHHGAKVMVAIQAQNQELCAEDRAEDSSSGCFPQTLRRIAIEAAAASGARVIDVPAALRHHDGGVLSGVAGWDYFYDSIHPTRLGHAVIGQALVPSASELLSKD